MRELERVVERPRRRQLMFVTGVVVGGGVMAAVFATRDEPTAVVVVDRPVVVAVAQPAPPPPPPTPAPPPPEDPLRCPAIEAVAPTGVIVGDDKLRTLPRGDSDEAAVQYPIVVAAAHAPVLATLDDDAHVRISDDDGATWQRAFEDDDIVEIAIADDGVIYARNTDELGTRTRDGKQHWRHGPTIECSGDCADRIVTAADAVVWIRNDKLAITRDAGKTWKPVATKDTAWSARPDGRMFAWAGAIYQVEHYWDMCGVNDYPVYKLDVDKARVVASTIFHDYYTSNGQPAELVPTDEVAPTWNWKARCWQNPDAQRACGPEAPLDLLAAKTLLPVQGARTLAVYNKALVELCPGGVHQVYREFPFRDIAAVDHAGRPLVSRERQLLRWSPGDGWRRLLKLRTPEPPQAE